MQDLVINSPSELKQVLNDQKIQEQGPDEGFLLIKKPSDERKGDENSDYILVKVTKRAIQGEKPVNLPVGILSFLTTGAVVTAAGAALGITASPLVATLGFVAGSELVGRVVTPVFNSASDWLTGTTSPKEEGNPYVVDVVGKVAYGVLGDLAANAIVPGGGALAKEAVKLVAGTPAQKAASGAASKVYGVAIDTLFGSDQQTPAEEPKVLPMIE